MSPQERADVETYASQRREVSELAELIELESAHEMTKKNREKEAATRRVIAELHQKKQAAQVGYGNTTGERLVYIGLPVIIMNALGFYLFFKFDEEELNASKAVGVLVLALIGVFVAVLVKFVREGLSPAKAKEAKRIEAEIKRLEKPSSPSSFGNSNISEFVALEQKRISLLEKYNSRNLSGLSELKQNRIASIVSIAQKHGFPLEITSQG